MPLEFQDGMSAVSTGRLFNPSNLPVKYNSEDKFVIRAQAILEPEQVKQVRGTGLPKTRPLHQIERIKSNTLAYKSNHVRDNFQQPEYDFVEIGRAEDTDGYISRSFTIKSGLMFKEGWELFGRNPNTVKYIKTRMRQIEVATKQSFDELLKRTGTDLIKYSNSFWLKVRNEDASGGQTRTTAEGKKLKPIAGYFIAAPESIEIKTDDFGNVLRYRQRLPYQQLYKEYRPEDVVHFHYNRKNGFLVGTPGVIPVLDDVRALRRIEENVEMLVYQHLFPLFHYQVGTPESPALTFPDGSSEIDIARSQIASMPSEGGIVTPERHKIEMIGAEGRALRAESYLKHFKQRVFAGLGVGSVDFGEGETANRSTSDNMSRSLVDSVKDYQRTLENLIETELLTELMLESTFNLDLIQDDENKVEFRFKEIDIESQIKVETHATDMYAKNVITESEARRKMGREPLSEEERKDTFWEHVEKPKALILASSGGDPSSLGAMEIAENPAFTVEEPERAKATGELQKRQLALKKAGSAGKTSSGSKAIASRNRPSNQHGRRSSPRRAPSRNSTESSQIFDTTEERALFLLDNEVKSQYNEIRSHLVARIKTEKRFDFDMAQALIQTTKARMISVLKAYSKAEFLNGFNSVYGDPSRLRVSKASQDLDFRVERFVGRLMEQIIKQLRRDIKEDGSDLPTKLAGVFDALEFRTDFIHRSELTKAKNYGLALAYKSLGHKTAYIMAVGGCNDCRKKHNAAISLAGVTLDDVPALHPNCQCTLAIEQTELNEESEEHV